MFGPVLRGQRVTLRPPDESDPPRFVAWLSDLEVTRFTSRQLVPYLEQEVDWFKRTGEATDRVFWIIEAEGRCIGGTGIDAIDWRNARGVTGMLIGELGARGKGYGTEAARLRTEYAFLQLNLHKLTSEGFVENAAIRRVLARTGYLEYGISREDEFRGGAWHDLWHAEILRSEWEARR